MSTYVDKATNPKTGKVQSAIFLDNYFGPRWYGIAFKNDGTAAVYEEIVSGKKLDLSGYTVYKAEEVMLTAKS